MVKSTEKKQNTIKSAIFREWDSFITVESTKRKIKSDQVKEMPGTMIMGISIVTPEEAENKGHYQYGESFEAFINSICELTPKIEKLILVETGYLHRHNLALEKQISLEAAENKAKECGQYWKAQHQSIIDKLKENHGIEVEVHSWEEWYQSPQAKKHLQKIEELHVNDLTLQSTLEEEAQKQVNKTFRNKFAIDNAILNSIFGRLRQLDGSMPKGKKKLPNTDNVLTEIETAFLNRLKQYKTLLIKNELEEVLLGSIEGTIRAISTTPQEDLKPAVFSQLYEQLTQLLNTVQNPFIESSKIYLLEEAAACLWFKELLEQTPFNIPVMTYKSKTPQPVFEYALNKLLEKNRFSFVGYDIHNKIKPQLITQNTPDFHYSTNKNMSSSLKNPESIPHPMQQPSKLSHSTHKKETSSIPIIAHSARSATHIRPNQPQPVANISNPHQNKRTRSGTLNTSSASSLGTSPKRGFLRFFSHLKSREYQPKQYQSEYADLIDTIITDIKGLRKLGMKEERATQMIQDLLFGVYEALPEDMDPQKRKEARKAIINSVFTEVQETAQPEILRELARLIEIENKRSPSPTAMQQDSSRSNSPSSFFYPAAPTSAPINKQNNTLTPRSSSSSTRSSDKTIKVF